MKPQIQTDIEARILFSNDGFNETLNNVDIPVSFQTLDSFKDANSNFNTAFFGGILVGPGPYSPQIVIGSNSGVNQQKVFIRRYITNSNYWTDWTELFTTKGGTITGNLTVRKDTNPSLYCYDASDNKQGIFQYVSDGNLLQILNYTDGNNYNGIYINNYDTSLLNSLRFVKKIDGTATIYNILHQGNYQEYSSILNRDLYLITGNNDRYIWFDYSQSASTMGASWRIGYRGTGSNDSNHFVIQRTGSATGDSETWSDVMQCWMNTKQVDFFANIYAKKDSGSVGVGCIRTDNSNQIGLLIGSGGVNKGLYDANLGAWVCFTDGTDCYFATSSKYNNAYLGSTNVYVNTTGVLYGAAWNDYAEYRTYPKEEMPYGRCVVEVGDDTMELADGRLIPGAAICSDTFGFAIGETDECNMPIAVSGRVLAYPYEGREEFAKNIGRPVCSGPNGTVSIMSDEEYKEKGYCCVGTISAIPNYEVWGTGNVNVDGRVWISV